MKKPDPSNSAPNKIGAYARVADGVGIGIDPSIERQRRTIPNEWIVLLCVRGIFLCAEGLSELAVGLAFLMIVAWPGSLARVSRIKDTRKTPRQGSRKQDWRSRPLVIELGLGLSFFEKFFLAVDHGIDVGGGKLETMAVSNGIGWASFNAITAKNAARVINVVHACVSLAGGNALCVSIFRSFDINATCRAGCRTQEASNTFFESTFIAMQDVNSTVAGLKMNGLFGIIFRDGLPHHIAESHAETFYEGDKRFASVSDDG